MTLSETDKFLLDNCRLIKLGTHSLFRRLGENKRFIKDEELKFKFGEPHALDQARQAANDVFESKTGCNGCPAYAICLPTVEVLTDYPFEHTLSPAY